ncbi:MAG TPA: hypothetical protein VKZ68_05020 [Ohtaekwangia sp.]|nr:hypothetical protein [Ohtaekwangia sp.]
MSKKNSRKPGKTRTSKEVKEERAKNANPGNQEANADENQDYGGMNMSNFRKNLGCG